MSIDTLKAKLDDAKERFLKAEDEIKNLRQEISELLCPLGIGDKVTLEEDGKTFEGIVEDVGPATKQKELLGPIVGAEAGWSACGHRLNKTTGRLGKWSFGINSFDYIEQGGRWILQKRTLEDMLGE